MVGMLSHFATVYILEKKTNEYPVTITTWQSVYRLERSFFEDYDVIIGDEAHLFKSKSLSIYNDKTTAC